MRKRAWRVIDNDYRMLREGRNAMKKRANDWVGEWLDKHNFLSFKIEDWEGTFRCKLYDEFDEEPFAEQRGFESYDAMVEWAFKAIEQHNGRFSKRAMKKRAQDYTGLDVWTDEEIMDIVCNEFGFDRKRVRLLEADMNHPFNHLLWRVLGDGVDIDYEVQGMAPHVVRCVWY